MTNTVCALGTILAVAGCATAAAQVEPASTSPIPDYPRLEADIADSNTQFAGRWYMPQGQTQMPVALGLNRFNGYVRICLKGKNVSPDPEITFNAYQTQVTVKNFSCAISTVGRGTLAINRVQGSADVDLEGTYELIYVPPN
ncbi:MAG: hypothetical protein AAFN91_10350 [Pseudomonadota bacterium]